MHNNNQGSTNYFFAYIKLFAIVIFWAVNFLLIKQAVSSIGPFTLTFFKFIGAGVIFGIFGYFTKRPLIPPKSERIKLAFIGLLSMSGVSVLGTFGISLLPPGRASVVTYTMPLFALPISYFLSGKKPSAVQIFGTCLGTVGLIIFLSPWQVNWTVPSTVLGYAIVILSAILWALGSCLLGNQTWQSSSFTQTFWQYIPSSVVCGILALIAESHKPIIWNQAVIIVVLYNCFIGCGLCFLWWTQVVWVMPTSDAGQITALVPILVLMMSAVFFHESLSLVIIINVLFIGLGIILTVRERFSSQDPHLQFED